MISNPIHNRGFSLEWESLNQGCPLSVFHCHRNRINRCFIFSFNNEPFPPLLSDVGLLYFILLISLEFGDRPGEVLKVSFDKGILKGVFVNETVSQ